MSVLTIVNKAAVIIAYKDPGAAILIQQFGIGLPGQNGAGANLATEIPTDNGNGTYTFTHTPIMIFINGGLGALGVNYTMSGLICTPTVPSGTGLGLMSLHG